MKNNYQVAFCLFFVSEIQNFQRSEPSFKRNSTENVGNLKFKLKDFSEVKMTTKNRNEDIRPYSVLPASTPIHMPIV